MAFAALRSGNTRAVRENSLIYISRLVLDSQPELDAAQAGGRRGHPGYVASASLQPQVENLHRR